MMLGGAENQEDNNWAENWSWTKSFSSLNDELDMFLKWMTHILGWICQ